MEFFADFRLWFEKQYQQPLANVSLLYIPNSEAVINAASLIVKARHMLMDERIILNKKDSPIQIGEWYAKSIFGLVQSHSTLQRGFNFYRRGIRIEVRVEWGTESSFRGVKIEKRMLELSTFCLIIYLSDQLMIRDVCIMDSVFVLKKWSGKGETIFLRDDQISQYFFTRSIKHMDKIQNVPRLLQFSSPAFADWVVKSLSIQEVPCKGEERMLECYS